jgi:hypothetical protein
MPLNKLKFRAWNYFLLYTPTHIIQFIFTDLSLGCTSSIIVFEKGKDPQLTLDKVEDLTCPTFDTETVGLGKIGTILDGSKF